MNQQVASIYVVAVVFLCLASISADSITNSDEVELENKSYERNVSFNIILINLGLELSCVSFNLFLNL
jgi:hypothetical protein